MTSPERLRNLLLRVRDSIPREEFCGVGVVVSADSERLPIVSLCTDAKVPAQQDLAEQIAECSLYSRPCHDGFQIVSEQWHWCAVINISRLILLQIVESLLVV